MPKYISKNHLKVITAIPDKDPGINNIEIVGKLVTEEKFINAMIQMTLEVMNDMYDNDEKAKKLNNYSDALKLLG